MAGHWRPDGGLRACMDKSCLAADRSNRQIRQEPKINFSIEFGARQGREARRGRRAPMARMDRTDLRVPRGRRVIQVRHSLNPETMLPQQSTRRRTNSRLDAVCSSLQLECRVHLEAFVLTFCDRQVLRGQGDRRGRRAPRVWLGDLVRKARRVSRIRVDVIQCSDPFTRQQLPPLFQLSSDWVFAPVLYVGSSEETLHCITLNSGVCDQSD